MGEGQISHRGWCSTNYFHSVKRTNPACVERMLLVDSMTESNSKDAWRKEGKFSVVALGTVTCLGPESSTYHNTESEAISKFLA